MSLVLLAQEAAASAPVVVSEHPIAKWFERFDEEHLFVLSIILIGCVTVVSITLITSITQLISSNRKGKAKAELIRELMDRGHSLGEIKEILAMTEESATVRALTQLRSGSKGSDAASWSVPPQKPIAGAR